MKNIERLDGIHYDRETIEKLQDKFLPVESDGPGSIINFFHSQDIDTVEKLCESEIEKQLAYALYWISKVEGLFTHVMPPSLYGNLFMVEPERLDETALALFNYYMGTDLIIIPNLPISCNGKNYRADFLLSYKEKGKKKRKFKLIECDSFMFHSSQKHITKDKQRERDLRSVGWDLVRFSGGEIHKNPSKIAYEILRLVLKYDEK